MKAIEIPKYIMHLHHLTGPASHYSISGIAITGTGKTATAVATNVHGLISVAWPNAQECAFNVPGALARKALSFCRADTAKQKDVVTVSANKDMTTITVSRMGVRKDSTVPLGVASISGFFSKGDFPKWRDLWNTNKPIVGEQVVGADAGQMAMMFSALDRIAGPQRGIKCEFTGANQPIRFTAEKRNGKDCEIKALLMPVDMDLA